MVVLYLLIIHPNSYQHYGKYDYTQNLQIMIESVKKLRNMNVNTININEHQIKSSSTYASDKVNNTQLKLIMKLFLLLI